MRNLIEENDFLSKYKERRRQYWRQVAGHKDSFMEGGDQVNVEHEIAVKAEELLDFKLGQHLFKLV